MTLFLKDEDVSRCVTMDAMLEAIESMQRHYGDGQVHNMTRRKIIAEGGMLSVMGGGLFHEGLLGVKTYTVVKGSYSFQVSLYDANTGELLLYTQANRLGQLRTGATTGVAVKHLANPGAATVGIIGTGGQAPTQLEAVSKVRGAGGIKRIKAFSRTQERREEFASRMTDAMGIEVSAAATNEAAVRDCDIVLCVAANMEPVVQGAWLKDGCTVIGAGPTTWRAREVDEATIIRAGKVIVDSMEQAAIEAGDLCSAVDKGIIQWSKVHELRHVVSGAVTGRDDEGQVIYAKIMGTGVADVAAAKLAYDSAKAMGLGTEMDW
ncbi:MAG: ornithine cyclodeaminase family protein [Chloroflexi bacterium]|nr:ornithine cyclodeaminase family protein [Chloroflexota bacterium]MCI0810460.1 ornithine cyclodeaminase family protein [Chloroflexota bacterium]MCI0828548.1 ornithine cyclodeaminase family protein [Chloroflexota bacterium]MCI0847067.1 ornithine cyclodeaminase family protein [Chloroflexota bacterium]MCI0863365.1 ornithine cyclodeaminase family protein [Chloroflexota bacterium]